MDERNQVGGAPADEAISESTSSPDEISPPPGGPNPRATSQALGCVVVGLFVAVPVLLYFGFFAALVVDEVMETRYLAPSNLPEPAVETIKTIYAPLFEATKNLVD